MATTPSNLSKQPYEMFPIEFDFDKQLDSDETIKEKVVTSAKGTVDTTSDIITGSVISSDGKIVIVGIKGGVDGDSHKITAKVITTKLLPGTPAVYSKYEGEITMTVVEILG